MVKTSALRSINELFINLGVGEEEVYVLFLNTTLNVDRLRDKYRTGF